MQFVQQSTRRTKVLATATALAGFIEPAFPAAPWCVVPHQRARRAGRFTAIRTAIPAAATAATAGASLVEVTRAGNALRRPGRIVATQSALPPIGQAAISEIRPDIVRPVLGPRQAAPRPVQARTWCSDPMARNHVPVVVPAGKLPRAGRVVASRMATPPEAPRQEAGTEPIVVKPAPKRQSVGKAVAARTPLVSGTLGLAPTNPTIVKAARRPTSAPRSTSATVTSGTAPIRQTPPTDAVTAVPVQRPRRAGTASATRMATVPSPPTTPSVTVRAAKRSLTPGKPATLNHSALVTPQPVPRVVAIAAGKAPRPRTPQPARTDTVRIATGLIQTPRPVPAVVRAAAPRKPAGKIVQTALPAGPQPNPAPIAPRKVVLPRPKAPRPLATSTAGTTPIRLVGPPQTILVRAGRLPRRAGNTTAVQALLTSAARHDPLPMAFVVPAARPPKRSAPQPLLTSNIPAWVASWPAGPTQINGLPPDLPAAVVLWLRQYLGVATAFGETITGNAATSTYKLFAEWNSTKSPMPYLVYQEVYEGAYGFQSQSGNGQTYAFPSGQFQISIFTQTKRQGRQLAELVAAVLNDAPLTFADGVLLEMRLESIHAIPEGDIGPGGTVTAYHFAMTFLYRVQRSLTFT